MSHSTYNMKLLLVSTGSIAGRAGRPQLVADHMIQGRETNKRAEACATSPPAPTAGL